MDKSSEDWKAKVTVLRENVEHHVEEEENEVFEQARSILSDDQAEKIGRLFQQHKQQFMKSA